jgi:Domain of unknown function (DUF1998)
MSKNAQRLSQVVSTFGPGAMVDLPTRSVVIGGLELWDMRGGSFTPIPEPRLTARLEQLLKKQLRLADNKSLSLRTPPVANAKPGQLPAGIMAPIFPTWFVCEQDSGGTQGASTRSRRLVRWQDLQPAGGRRKFIFDDGTRSDVTPIRFVCACENGHLQDIDWKWVVHGPQQCQEPMWVEERGTSADPADMTILCGCGKQLSLRDLFVPGRLGFCRGERPWLLDREPHRCGQKLKLLTRTATNTYFPQVYTVISLPSEEDELTRLVHGIADELKDATSTEDIALARKFNSKIAATLAGYSDADVFVRLQQIREGATADAGGSPKLSEFEVFASGRAEIGQNNPAAKLYAQTLPRAVWADPAARVDLSAIRNVVAVHRLREVSCLYGFTRFEAAPTSADGELEDIQLAVRGAPLAQDADWLPAIEQFGEGIFIHFDEGALRDWLKRETTKNRRDKLATGYSHWIKRFSGKPPPNPGTAYVLLHSLSHALMAEIALDCGYPASSLKERVYALSGADGAPERCGILIYTASAGAQGTLGGLVGVAPRLAQILANALDRSTICSNDPICADHEPDNRSGDRATHGAACHGCLLIAETSCEMRNLFLDRSLLVPTMGTDGAAFFTLPREGI